MLMLSSSFFFPHLTYYLRPSSRNSHPGSRSRLFCPPHPLRFVPCIFITRRFQLFLASSTRVELFIYTLGHPFARDFRQRKTAFAAIAVGRCSVFGFHF